VSQIPYLSRLGDALEAAAARSAAPRRLGLHGRMAILAAAGVLIAAGTATARILATPEERQAANFVYCADQVALNRGMTGLPARIGVSPIQTCTDLWKEAKGTVPPLTACLRDAGVVVFPTADPAVCAGLGLKPVSPEFQQAKQRYDELGRRVRAIQRSRDCWTPKQLAARIRRLLGQPGWEGWQVTVRNSGFGPCGSAFGSGDDDVRRHASFALDAEHRTVIVAKAVSATSLRLIYGAGRQPGLLDRLFAGNDLRCPSERRLRAYANRTIARLAPGRKVTIDTTSKYRGAPPDPIAMRLQRGCASIWAAGFDPGNGRDFKVTIVQPAH
jgi:hypothetical protein